MAILIKTEEQIEGIRKSCELAAGALEFIEPHVQAGISTLELDALVEQFIRDHGAIPAPLGYLGYPKSICTSINEVICHGIPNETRLADGDIINIDVTTILNGYYGDTSKMFAVGDISPDAKKLLAVARDCLDVGITQVRPDKPFGDISKAITEYALRRNFSVVHQFCGHGTGVQFHEEPQINHNYNGKEFDSRKMQPGMIFTIEPMINQGLSEALIDKKDKWTARTVDGKLSAQFEHTVLVTSGGVEVLTK
jgi:methionyl aminopeptidase